MSRKTINEFKGQGLSFLQKHKKITIGLMFSAIIIMAIINIFSFSKNQAEARAKNTRKAIETASKVTLLKNRSLLIESLKNYQTKIILSKSDSTSIIDLTNQLRKINTRLQNEKD